MRQNDSYYLGFAAITLLVPFITAAQQRGGVGPGGLPPAAAPARPAVVATGLVHAPVHPVAPNVALRPTGHPYTPSVHPLAPRIAGHPAAPKAPVHNHPIRLGPIGVHGPTIFSGAAVEDGNGVPGLGFDYPHYAATHPNAGHPHHQDGSVFPFIGGGIYIPTTGYPETGTPTQAATDEQQAEAQDSTAETSEATAVERPGVASQVGPRSNANPPPAAEYIFVRCDGTVFFAVAYSWVNGNLQYVTQEGVRKFVSTTTLDLDATTQFNEQRGVVFHSPA
jgi:hypothetical protein